MTTSKPLELPAAPRWLDPSQLTAALMSAPGQISEVGRALAHARFLFVEAENARKKEEAFLYQAARLQLEEGAPPEPAGKGDKPPRAPKAPTEAQVQSHMRTDPELGRRYDNALLREATAEARYEALRADYKAVCTEAEMLAEVARNQRAELQNLDPTVRFPAVGRSYPSPAPRQPAADQLLPSDPRFSGFGLSNNAEDGPL
mgnify:CR=1 FL=1